MKKLFLILVLVSIGGCRPKPPQPPTPPSPSPLPDMEVLTLKDGNKFSTDLKGAVPCCSDPGQLSGIEGYPQNNWPFVSDDLLKMYSNTYKLNYTHIRTGPFTRDGEQTKFEGYVFENGKYDLTKFEPIFSGQLIHTVEEALKNKIYIEIDLIDGWVVKCLSQNDCTLSPWANNQNLQGIADTSAIVQNQPQPHHEAWARHVVGLTCKYPNVMYQVGNETGVIHSTPVWELGIFNIANDEMRNKGCSQKLVGSNSDTMMIDYRTYHTYEIPAPENIAVLVNETDNRVTTGYELGLRSKIASSRSGVYFQAWKGDMLASEWYIALDYLVNKVGELPSAPLFGCPDLKGVKVKILRFGPDQCGTKYVMDSTPDPVVDGEGSDASIRCNDIWMDSPNPQPLQDGKGPVWNLVSGPGSLERNWQNHYLAFLCNPGPGTIVEACSQANSTCGRFSF